MVIWIQATSFGVEPLHTRNRNTSASSWGILTRIVLAFDVSVSRDAHKLHVRPAHSRRLYIESCQGLKYWASCTWGVLEHSTWAFPCRESGCLSVFQVGLLNYAISMLRVLRRAHSLAQDSANLCLSSECTETATLPAKIAHFIMVEWAATKSYVRAAIQTIESRPSHSHKQT